MWAYGRWKHGSQQWVFKQIIGEHLANNNKLCEPMENEHMAVDSELCERKTGEQMEVHS